MHPARPPRPYTWEFLTTGRALTSEREQGLASRGLRSVRQYPPYPQRKKTRQLRTNFTNDFKGSVAAGKKPARSDFFRTALQTSLKDQTSPSPTIARPVPSLERWLPLCSHCGLSCCILKTTPVREASGIASVILLRGGRKEGRELVFTEHQALDLENKHLTKAQP